MRHLTITPLAILLFAMCLPALLMAQTTVTNTQTSTTTTTNTTTGTNTGTTTQTPTVTITNTEGNTAVNTTSNTLNSTNSNSSNTTQDTNLNGLGNTNLNTNAQINSDGSATLQFNTTTNTVVPNNPQIDINAQHHENAWRAIYLNPAALASDYEAAFREIRATQPDARVYAIVKGQSMDRIIDVKAMPNQHLLLFTLDYGSSPLQKVVRVDEVEEFGVRNTPRRQIRLNFPSSIPNAP